MTFLHNKHTKRVMETIEFLETLEGQKFIKNVLNILEDSLIFCPKCGHWPEKKRLNYNDLWEETINEMPCQACMEVARIKGRFAAMGIRPYE